MRKYPSITFVVCLLIALICYIKIGCNAHAGNPGEVRVPAASHLWMYCRPKCPPCHRGKRALRDSLKYDLHIIEVTDKSPAPRWITEACNANPDLGYPFWVWRDHKGRPIYVSGFSDFQTLDRRIRGTQ